MPLFNASRTMYVSIDSVLSQTLSDLELILVDDFSSDESLSVANDYKKKDSRVNVISLDKNLGAGYARNVAIKAAKGRFIAFLDSDDVWSFDKLEKQIGFMLEHNYALTYTAYQKFSDAGDGGVIVPPECVSYSELLYGNVIGCLTAIYDSKILGKRYMPLIRKRQDMGLWLDILKDIPKAYCLNEVLAKYRTDSGMSSNKWKVLSYQWEFYRKVVGLGFFKTCLVFSVYSIKGLIKYRV